MTLQEWMQIEGIDIGSVAQTLACTVEAVRRYLKGARIPGRAAMIRIYRMTEGRVTPNDFYGVGEAHESGPKSICTAPSFGKADKISGRVLA